MANQQEQLENFAAITGCTDEMKAFGLLDASGWDLGTAIELFFASEGGDQAAQPPPVSATEDADAALAKRLAEEDEQSVRAPMPTKTERLYADMPAYTGPQPSFLAGHRDRASKAPKPPVDAFRDFKSEGEGSSKGGSSGPGLSDLFQPPTDLTFPGTFDQAKAKALAEDKWLLLNVQSGSEFASHQLNRDTWKNETVRGLLDGMFVFFQTQDNAAEGPRLMHNYHIAQLPAILVIDPITGARMFQKIGFVGPETLADHLVPYLDHGPSNAGSAMLAQTSLKRKFSQDKPLTEDEELARAIAASMAAPTSSTDAAGGTGAGAVAAGVEVGDDEEDDEVQLQRQLDRQVAEQQAAEAAARAPAEALAAAQARLPPPPADNDPLSTRVAVRLPDGSRLQRSFLQTDPVQVLHDFCLTEVPEASAGRQFGLVLAMPGAPALADTSQTLKDAGLVNAMLVFKWQD